MFLFPQKNPLFSKFIKMRPWGPKCYFANEKLLIFEDLRMKGYKMREKCLKSLDIISGLKAIARFHASSIIVESKLNFSLKDFFPCVFKEKIFVTSGEGWLWLRTGMRAIEAVAKRLNYDSTLVKKAYKLAIKKVKLNEGYLNVLTHLDLWKNNIFF